MARVSVVIWVSSCTPSFCSPVITLKKYLIGENNVRGVGWIDTVGLQWNKEFSTVLKIHVAVLSNNSGLIWLGNVSENDVNHTDQESVVLWLSGIMDNGNDVGSLLSHVDQISSNSVWELNCVNETFRTDDIRDVGNGSSRGGSEIKNLGSWVDTGFGDTSDDWCGNFGSIRVPYSVFYFLSVNLDADSFFIIDTISRCEVFSH